MAQPNAQWYDMATIEEMHDDMQREYLKTLAIISTRPSLLRHFNSCSECQTIKNAQETGEAYAPASMEHREILRRRKVFILTSGDMTDLLGLPANSAILFMRVTGQSDVLEVTACSPDYEPVAYGVQPTVTRVEAV